MSKTLFLFVLEMCSLMAATFMVNLVHAIPKTSVCVLICWVWCMLISETHLQNHVAA
ncbi:hypothetical protein Goshw_001177 [Gossypium schwendimanii]|uniref:Uncharacterized protein n=2 Tax=Gossypium TaxID=3633 RepID=A0A7J9MF12_GOSSC|nr:hypothetical protein [Gossypium klotzschianum]MBA0869662.1 hypothetical protein [Gossypium schwendimanii]